jgi:hypothetical protein
VTTIDFKRAIQDAKSASFEALPVGDYDVEVVESTAVRSSNGKPMVKVTFPKSSHLQQLRVLRR